MIHYVNQLSEDFIALQAVCQRTQAACCAATLAPLGRRAVTITITITITTTIISTIIIITVIVIANISMSITISITIIFITITSGPL